jgi:hypothetical protein
VRSDHPTRPAEPPDVWYGAGPRTGNRRRPMRIGTRYRSPERGGPEPWPNRLKSCRDGSADGQCSPPGSRPIRSGARHRGRNGATAEASRIGFNRCRGIGRRFDVRRPAPRSMRTGACHRSPERGDCGGDSRTGSRAAVGSADDRPTDRGHGRCGAGHATGARNRPPLRAMAV